jgi:hypothetical protein
MYSPPDCRNVNARRRRRGEHVVECVIPQMPLAAGDYVLGAGITAESNRKWIWRDGHLGVLRVEGSDVFALGNPPAYSRMVVAVPHSWREPVRTAS